MPVLFLMLLFAGVAPSSEFIGGGDPDEAGAEMFRFQMVRAQSTADTVAPQYRHFEAEFSVQEPFLRPRGWVSAGSAAIAFFRANETRYQGMRFNGELVGFVLASAAGHFYYTNAVETPGTVILHASVGRPEAWRVMAFLHTHPPDERGYRASLRQESFSEFDRQGALTSTTEYFLRTPAGDVLYMNREIASEFTAEPDAVGRSVCPRSRPCLPPHHVYARQQRGADLSLSLRAELASEDDRCYTWQ